MEGWHQEVNSSNENSLCVLESENTDEINVIGISLAYAADSVCVCVCWGGKYLMCPLSLIPVNSLHGLRYVVLRYVVLKSWYTQLVYTFNRPK